MENEASPKNAGVNKKPEQTGSKNDSPQPKKKMTGVGFYIVLTVLFINDIFGVLANLSVIFFIFTIFSGIMAQGITMLYLYWNGVKLNERKLASFLISSIIEVIPLVNLLPAGTLNLLAIRTIENNNIAKKLAEHKTT